MTQTATGTWIELAHRLGKEFAAEAEAHDEADSFVVNNYARLKECRVFSAAIPEEFGGGGANAILAPDQEGGAESLMDEACSTADHLLFLAFGEDHALGIRPDMLEDVLQGAGDRVEAGRKLDSICVEVGANALPVERGDAVSDVIRRRPAGLR